MKLTIATALLLAATAQAATSAPFSYSDQAINGPHNWAKLPIDNNQCAGQKNSPIAVETSDCDRYEDYKFDHGTCLIRDLKFDLTDTGVKASYPSDGACQNPTVEIPGIPGKYQALQFHIHTSSEHTIDGEFFSAELHTVHKEINGDRFAVVGMMIQPSSNMEHENFGALLAGWQAKYVANERWCGVGIDDSVATSGGGGRRELEDVSEAQRKLQFVPFSPYDMIPEGATYYHYDGGLTTPPCSEVVWWNLADKPVAISPAQYNMLVNHVLHYTEPNKDCELGTNAGPVGSTSRPVQPLNGRTVERICPVGFKENEPAPTTNESDGDSAASSIMTSALTIATIVGGISSLLL